MSLKKPETIEELRNWYKSKNLPPYSQTGFYIGKDIKKPGCFGIYKDEQTGNITVYKNKSSGERVIRYSGNDEAYAVKEIHEKLKEEILKRKYITDRSMPSDSSDKNKENGGNKKFDPVTLMNNADLFLTKHLGRAGHIIFRTLTYGVLSAACTFVIVFIAGLIIRISGQQPQKGYYQFNDKVYYYLSDWYYYYDDEWTEIDSSDLPDVFNDTESLSEYYFTPVWSDEDRFSDFEDTDFYLDYLENCHDDEFDDDDESFNWDDSSSWDYDDTDWDSDW